MSTLKWAKPYVKNFPNFQHLEDERGYVKASVDHAEGVWYIRADVGGWVKYPELKSVDEARAMALALYRMGVKP